MPDPKVSLSGGNFTVSGYAPAWSLGNLGQVKLGDHFQIQRPGGLSDIEFGFGLHVLDITWGKKGTLWLEQSLSVGGKYSFTRSQAQGSLQLSNTLLWVPMKELQFTFSFIITGKVDHDGATSGTVQFGSNFKMVDTHGAMLGAGLRF
jgi:hypothetical protein